jgi:hypothetical protein
VSNKQSTGGRFKTDGHAKALWGDAYDAIPKSVWATMAWHLANIASDAPDVAGSAEARALAELDALGGQIIPERQAKAAIAAIRNARKEAGL